MVMQLLMNTYSPSLPLAVLTYGVFGSAGFHFAKLDGVIVALVVAFGIRGFTDFALFRNKLLNPKNLDAYKPVEMPMFEDFFYTLKSGIGMIFIAAIVLSFLGGMGPGSCSTGYSDTEYRAR